MNEYGELTIASRFNGPARSGNGGYAAGALASALLEGGDPHRVAQVTLRKPPPLDTPMLLADHRSKLIHDGATVAEAKLVTDEIDLVEPVGYDAAAAAMASYLGLRAHPFPTCFGCGVERPPGDGLRIFPGPVGEGVVASTWTPHPSVADGDEVGAAVTWAALDCTGGWSSGLEERPMVLGRMTARVDAAPRVGEPHVVVGRLLGTEGRKTFTLSTLYDADGRMVARAGHVWIEVDPAAFA